MTNIGGKQRAHLHKYKKQYFPRNVFILKSQTLCKKQDNLHKVFI